MKNFYFILLIILFIGNINIECQTLPNVYQQMFDKTKGMVINTYMQNSNYYGDSYGDGISYLLEGLLNMYELTNNKKYLDDFSRITYKIILNRDDIRHFNLNKPYWSSDDRKIGKINFPGAITYQTALILQPIVHYIYLSKKVYQNKFNNAMIYPTLTFDNIPTTNYNKYADWLYVKVKETYDYYNNYYWIPDRGYKQYANDYAFSTSSDVDGMDRNCNWGVVNTYLAVAFNNSGDPMRNIYFDHAQTAAYQLKLCMNEETYSINGAEYYQWSYRGWVNEQWNSNTNKYSKIPVDDISHAGAVMDFAYVCNKFKNIIKSTTTSDCCPNGYFTDTDMIKLANTLIYKIYQDPLKYHNAINGTCEFYNWPNCGQGDFIMPNGNCRWLQLSKVNDPSKYYSTVNLTYPILSDFYSTFLEMPELTFSKCVPNCETPYIRSGGSVGATCLGIALSAKNQGYFNFLGRNSNPGGSHDNDWQGVASGDFDNDGIKNEIVCIRNSDGGIYFYKILPNDTKYSDNNLTVDFKNVGYKFVFQGSVLTGGVSTGADNSNWRGITVGHFIKDIPGDQIGAVRESDGAFFVWKPIYNASSGTYSLQSILSNNTSGTGNDWIGITSGDFDNDGIAEIASIRNFDGGIFIWKINGIGGNYNFSSMIYDKTSGTNNQWSALTCGDFDKDGIPELAAVRNADGGIFVWKILKSGNIYSLSGIVVQNSSGQGNKWNGMTVGDFNSDGTKDLILHRDFDGAFFIFNVNGTSLTSKAVEYFPVNQDLRVFCKCDIPMNDQTIINSTTKKTKKESKDIIVNLRNSDGDMVLYEVKF